MSLKKKTVALLLLFGSVLALIFQLSFRFTLSPFLEDQKEVFIEKLKRKIQMSLSIEFDKISILCSDWADWERLLQFLKKPTVDFESTALPDAMFTDEMLDLAVMVNHRREIVFCKNYFPAEGFMSLYKMDIRFGVKQVDNMIHSTTGPIRGFINTPLGPIMIVASPILDKGNLNRRMGELIMGRYVDRRMLDRFSSYTTEKIESLDFNRNQLLSFHMKQMKGQDVHYSEHPEKITVFQLIRDVQNFPSMVLFIETDNHLFRDVSRHVLKYMLITTILVILLGMFLYLSIDRYIVKRILTISDRMRQIEGLKDLSTRVDRDGDSDEIALLITSINLTLDKLENEKMNREKAEKTMIKQGKLASIGRLTSSIAHEINNPLLAIGNSLQVIKSIASRQAAPSPNDDTEMMTEAIAISDSELHRIRDIISGMLDFHRLDKEEFSKVNLKKLIQHSLNLLKWGKQLAPVEVIQELDESCFVYGAPVKLEQVFINFILNAMEAMNPEKGERNQGDMGALTIRVTPSADNRYAEIHFIDSGPGLAPNILGSLFEPFISTKTDRGVGLGLYISYKIIEQHHGEIVYNEEFKQGAHFIIRLPLNRR